MRIRDIIKVVTDSDKVTAKLNGEASTQRDLARKERQTLRTEFLLKNLKKVKTWKVAVGKWSFFLYAPSSCIPPTFRQLFRPPLFSAAVSLEEYGGKRAGCITCALREKKGFHVPPPPKHRGLHIQCSDNEYGRLIKLAKKLDLKVDWSGITKCLVLLERDLKLLRKVAAEQDDRLPLGKLSKAISRAKSSQKEIR